MPGEYASGAYNGMTCKLSEFCVSLSPSACWYGATYSALQILESSCRKALPYFCGTEGAVWQRPASTQKVDLSSVTHSMAVRM
ncbi:hypothetical protein BDR05DRAFT_958428 [Suillus weaverae]|nr:hypothetical protein BDR05DRAFT_958428 [Suillus weaverae]